MLLIFLNVFSTTYDIFHHFSIDDVGSKIMKPWLLYSIFLVHKEPSFFDLLEPPPRLLVNLNWTHNEFFYKADTDFLWYKKQYEATMIQSKDKNTNSEREKIIHF